MDVKNTMDFAANVWTPGALDNTSKNDKTQSQAEQSSQLLSGINTKTEEGRKQLQERASKIDARTVMQEYALQFQMGAASVTQNSFGAQSALDSSNTHDIFKIRSILSGIDAKLIGYEGKNLADLTPEEAKNLIGDDGFFGKQQTADRIADFVISGAGDDLEKLLKGREGVEQGFKQAEKLWGGKLPEISQESYKAALEKIDKRIEELQKPQESLNISV